MDAAGSQVGGSVRRSSEYLLHEAVYKARPDVGAVIHCHCPYLTAYAIRYEDFVVPENCSLHEVFRRFVCLPWGKGGTHEIHRGIEDALADSPICLLGGHGVVCVSTTLEDCLSLLEAAEGFAKTLYLARHMD
jgi:L-fuculose-phosphate aldolase